MDWLTKDYIEAAKGRKQAIECTRLHWWQLVKAGPETLGKALNIDFTVEISDDYCAMCQRYFDSWRYDVSKKCRKCPLKCHKVWQRASDALDEWIDNPTRTNWRKWKKAAKAMLAKIDRLHERLYGK